MAHLKKLVPVVSTVALLFIAVFSFVIFNHRAAATSVLDPSRSIDWTSPGVLGGIPTRNTICSTFNPGSTAAQINTALANCPNGQVVFLNAGTYTLGGGIDFGGRSNVTLRGAGPDKTFVKFTSVAGCDGLGGNVCMLNPSGVNPDSPQNTANWTAGYAKGATSITLSNTSGLAVGSIVELDQLNDSDTDNGGIWVCDDLACSSEGGEGLTRANRAQVQVVSVTSISGNTVGISPGLYMPNWRASQNPGAWWVSDYISGDGVENISLDYSNANGANGIFLGNVRDSWIENVRSIDSDRAAVWVDLGTRITVRDSYFYGTQNSQSQSYGIETDNASNIYAENNIFQHIAGGQVTGKGVGSSVYGYNYSLDDYYDPYYPQASDWQQASTYHHAAGIDFVLFEGDEGIGFTDDNIHGTAEFMTAFRNYFNGRDPQGGSSAGKNAQTDPVIQMSSNRYFNYIGNVLGTAGYHTNYECAPTTGSTAACAQNGDTSIFTIGWSGNGGSIQSPLQNDLLVKSTMMRWGNYDTVNNAVRWNASEVPSGLSQFANPVPPDQTLPISLYLPAQPTWWTTPWGTPPWPAVGPDVSGGNLPGIGGHAYMIPAELCYKNSPADGNFALDSSGNHVLLFNANNCYGAASSDTTPPTVPTGLAVTGVTASSISLSWNASTDNVGVLGYRVFRNGVQVNSGIATNYTDSGLAAGTTYAYTVAAFDGAGNVSAQSAGVNGTTSPPDVTPPTVVISAPANNATVSSTITISANAADNVAVANVQFNIDGSAVTTVNAAPYSFSWNSASVGNGAHTVTAIATDSSGNKASTTIAITTSNTSFPVSVVATSPGASGQSCAGCTALSWSHTISGSNPLLTVAVAVGSAADGGLTLTATYNGVAMTSAGKVHANNQAAGFTQLFYLAAPAAGAHTVQVTLAGGSADLEGGAVGFTGVNQATPVQNVKTGFGAGTPASITVTSAVNDMVVDAIVNGNSITSSGQTLRWLDNQNIATAGGNGAQSTAVGAASVTMSYVVSSDWWGMVGMDIVAAGGSGGGGDVTPPTTSITAPVAGATISGAASPVTATASDNVGVTKVELYVDGALKLTDLSSPYNFSLDTTGLTNASHALQTKAYDAAGNIGASTAVSVTVNNADITPPTVPTGLTVTGTTTSTASLSWTASTDNVGVTGYKVFRNGAQVGTSAGTSLTDSGLAANTTYAYTVSANDAAGNNSAQSAAVNATTQVALDVTPPTTSITAPVAGATISGAASPVTATASDNVGVTKVELYVDGALKLTDLSSPYNFSLDTTGLTNASHALQTKAYDAAGNIGTSATVSVTVNNVAQTLTGALTSSAVNGTAPMTITLTATAGGTAAGTMNFTFYCNRADTGTNITLPNDLAVQGTNTNPFIATNVCTYSVAGTYTAKVIIERGSAPAAQAQVTITVTGGGGGGDTTPPTIPAGLAKGAVTTSSVVLSWTASTDNVGVAGYKVYRGGAQVATSSGIGTSFTVVGLSASTTYSFQVAAYDAAGNTSGLSAPLSVTTLPPPDTTAPTATMTAPANNATVAGSVTVSATASDNVAVASVQFSLDGVSLGALIATPPYQVFWNTLTATNGAHTLRAIATDSSGNIGNSATISVTVSNAPIISVTAPANNATVAGNVTLIANATGSVASVQFVVDGLDFGPVITTLPYQTPWNTATAANGAHTIRAKAFDTAGNQAISSIINVTVNNGSGTSTLGASLGSTALSGTAPLAITLTANAQGNATGSLNYTFYCDNPNTTTTVTSPNDLKINGATSTSYTATNLCTYSSAGTYTPKVIIEQGTLAAMAQVVVSVSAQSSGGGGGGGGSGGGGSSGGGGGGSSLPIYFTRTLKTGDTGSDVHLLQVVLTNLGFIPTSTALTSTFATSTSHAMVLFQAAHLLPQTGALDSSSAVLMNKVVDANSSLTTAPGTVPTPAPAPSPSGRPPFTRFLTFGMTGSDVSELQDVLREEGYLNNPSTGYYGALTTAAVMKFQASKGFTQTGSVGPLTRAVLNTLIGASGTGTSPSPAPTPITIRTLFLGMAGDDVKAVQQTLITQGYLNANPTGYFGVLTQSAVEAYQCTEAIVCSGSPDTTGFGAVGPRTRVRMSGN